MANKSTENLLSRHLDLLLEHRTDESFSLRIDISDGHYDLVNRIASSPYATRQSALADSSQFLLRSMSGVDRTKFL